MNPELKAYLDEREARLQRNFDDHMALLDAILRPATRLCPSDHLTASCVTGPVAASSVTTEFILVSAGLAEPPAPSPSIVASPVVAAAIPIDASDMVPASCSTECAAQAVTASTTTTLLPWASKSSSSPATSATNGVVSTELAPDNDADEHGASLAPYSLSSSPTQYTAWEHASPTAPTSCTDPIEGGHIAPVDAVSAAIIAEVVVLTCFKPEQNITFPTCGVTTMALLQDGVPELPSFMDVHDNGDETRPGPWPSFISYCGGGHQKQCYAVQLQTAMQDAPNGLKESEQPPKCSSEPSTNSLHQVVSELAFPDGADVYVSKYIKFRQHVSDMLVQVLHVSVTLNGCQSALKISRWESDIVPHQVQFVQQIRYHACFSLLTGACKSAMEFGIQWQFSIVSDKSQVAFSAFSDVPVNPFAQWLHSLIQLNYQDQDIGLESVCKLGVTLFKQTQYARPSIIYLLVDVSAIVSQLWRIPWFRLLFIERTSEEVFQWFSEDNHLAVQHFNDSVPCCVHRFSFALFQWKITVQLEERENYATDNLTIYDKEVLITWSLPNICNTSALQSYNGTMDAELVCYYQVSKGREVLDMQLLRLFDIAVFSGSDILVYEPVIIEFRQLKLLYYYQASRFHPVAVLEMQGSTYRLFSGGTGQTRKVQSYMTISYSNHCQVGMYFKVGHLFYHVVQHTTQGASRCSDAPLYSSFPTCTGMMMKQSKGSGELIQWLPNNPCGSDISTIKSIQDRNTLFSWVFMGLDGAANQHWMIQWDPGGAFRIRLVALTADGLKFYMCHRQAPFQGGRNAIAVTTFFEQVLAGHKYYLDFDQVRASDKYYLGASFEWVPVSQDYCSCLVHAYPNFVYYRDSGQITGRRLQWDPGGFSVMSAWGQAEFQGGRDVRTLARRTSHWADMGSSWWAWPSSKPATDRHIQIPNEKQRGAHPEGSGKRQWRLFSPTSALIPQSPSCCPFCIRIVPQILVTTARSSESRLAPNR